MTEPDADPPPLFSVVLDPHRETIRVAASGELDVATARELDTELQRVIRDGFRRVVLDLRGLSFIDSTGVNAVLRARRMSEEQGVAFALVKGADVSERVFAAAGITHVLHFIGPGQIDGPLMRP
jgi:anti-anti-sigma factor